MLPAQSSAARSLSGLFLLGPRVTPAPPLPATTRSAQPQRGRCAGRGGGAGSQARGAAGGQPQAAQGGPPQAQTGRGAAGKGLCEESCASWRNASRVRAGIQRLRCIEAAKVMCAAGFRGQCTSLQPEVLLLHTRIAQEIASGPRLGGPVVLQSTEPTQLDRSCCCLCPGRRATPTRMRLGRACGPPAARAGSAAASTLVSAEGARLGWQAAVLHGPLCMGFAYACCACMPAGLQASAYTCGDVCRPLPWD